MPPARTTTVTLTVPLDLEFARELVRAAKAGTSPQIAALHAEVAERIAFSLTAKRAA